MIEYIYPAICNECGMRSGSNHGAIIVGAIPANQKERYICPDCVRRIIESQTENLSN